jgi:hypothetical protein
VILFSIVDETLAVIGLSVTLVGIVDEAGRLDEIGKVFVRS